MAAPNLDAPGSGSPFDWILALVAAVVVLLTTIDLVSELYFSARGEHETGTIVSAERAAGRSRTVIARVKVAPKGATPSSIEIRDTFGTHGWKEGDAVDMLCAPIHADHLNCVADAWVDRYAVSLIVLNVAAALVWLRLRARARSKAVASARGGRV